MWGATASTLPAQTGKRFQSTLPVWGATARKAECERRIKISIHAPRVGSDLNKASENLNFNISIHAPRVGSDCEQVFSYASSERFQSTLPVWGATFPWKLFHLSTRNFNPRSPCGERHEVVHQIPASSAISIHAPRVGSDKHIMVTTKQAMISIHAPRVGSDYLISPGHCPGDWISIHAPRVGSDRLRPDSVFLDLIFQSTLPVWGATKGVRAIPFHLPISIHAPRVGSDCLVQAQ